IHSGEWPPRNKRKPVTTGFLFCRGRGHRQVASTMQRPASPIQEFSLDNAIMQSDPQLDYLRVPPHSIEAEQSVLGGLLLDNAAFDRVSDVLTEDDFYRYDHRLIWQHIARLISLSRPADVITVHESLATSGKSEEVGGLPYLNALA